MFIKTLPVYTGLTTAEGEANAAGINRLRLIPAELLTVALPDPNSEFDLPDLYIDSRSIFLNDATDFVDIDVIPEYASYSEDLVEDANGEVYQCSIQLAIPKDRPDVTAWIHRNRQKRWVALIRDRNGFIRLVGTDQQPLQLSVKGGLGAKNGRNGRTLALSTNAIMPSLYVDSIESVDLFATTEFDFSFSHEFNT
ncbi:hypothetical protein BWI97_08770 [Siphonobacter sp. BAB-5405]|uniref:hypothetical protein n=1 Tax=Siphonobacter sp. BAB-5405 TaxID=1864825 RepID=UPI000C80FA11|nr:hypothetical protein [Siphonobacter sp. BAB-5405]PMD97692.1 hypothetical protein BWI97_08770 [Siphonobacter sp. BAB-5405]